MSTEKPNESEFKVSNSMITASKSEDKVIIRVLREAITDADVKLCLDVFDDFMNNHLKPTEKIRILVDAQIKVSVTKVKMSIVNAFVKHFQANFKKYDSHLNKCSLLVADPPLALMFKGVVKLIIKDSNRICVTHNDKRAKDFLK